MMLSLDAASWASFTQRLTTSKLHFSRCYGQQSTLRRGRQDALPSYLLAPAHRSVQLWVLPQAQPRASPLCCFCETLHKDSSYPHSLPWWQISYQTQIPTICHPKGWIKSSPARFTKKAGGTLRSGDTETLFFLLKSNSDFSSVSQSAAQPPRVPSYTPGKTPGQSWRHWAPCPRWPVSCSAR